jgi:hypothetical protein
MSDPINFNGGLFGKASASATSSVSKDDNSTLWQATSMSPKTPNTLTNQSAYSQNMGDIISLMATMNELEPENASLVMNELVNDRMDLLLKPGILANLPTIMGVLPDASLRDKMTKKVSEKLTDHFKTNPSHQSQEKLKALKSYMQGVDDTTRSKMVQGLPANILHSIGMKPAIDDNKDPMAEIARNFTLRDMLNVFNQPVTGNPMVDQQSVMPYAFLMSSAYGSWDEDKQSFGENSHFETMIEMKSIMNALKQFGFNDQDIRTFFKESNPQQYGQNSDLIDSLMQTNMGTLIMGMQHVVSGTMNDSDNKMPSEIFKLAHKHGAYTLPNTNSSIPLPSAVPMMPGINKNILGTKTPQSFGKNALSLF